MLFLFFFRRFFHPGSRPWQFLPQAVSDEKPGNAKVLARGASLAREEASVRLSAKAPENAAETQKERIVFQSSNG